MIEGPESGAFSSPDWTRISNPSIKVSPMCQRLPYRVGASAIPPHLCRGAPVRAGRFQAVRDTVATLANCRLAVFRASWKSRCTCMVLPAVRRQ